MLTIAWDVDDVLNNLMRIWFETCWLPRHPSCKLNYEAIKENPPHSFLGVELDEYLQSLDYFRCSGAYSQLQPNPQVVEWFQEQGFLFRHIALTAVPRAAAHISAAWVIRYFGDWIRTFHFVPSLRSNQVVPEYEKTKPDYLNWLKKVDVFIDDNPNNLAGLEAGGIKPLLLSRPWNSSSLRMDDLLRIISQLN
jgi:5'(3')-deoxyribonucleotidase